MTGKVTRFKPHLLARVPWDALDQLTQPGVTTLVTGATSPGQVTANATATTWRPAPAEETELRALFAGDLSGAPGRSTAG